MDPTSERKAQNRPADTALRLRASACPFFPLNPAGPSSKTWTPTEHKIRYVFAFLWGRNRRSETCPGIVQVSGASLSVRDGRKMRLGTRLHAGTCRRGLAHHSASQTIVGHAAHRHTQPNVERQVLQLAHASSARLWCRVDLGTAPTRSVLRLLVISDDARSLPPWVMMPPYCVHLLRGGPGLISKCSAWRV